MNDVPQEAKSLNIPAALTPEQISSLPLCHFQGTLHIVRKDEEVDEAVRALRQESVLGFDTETRATFKRGESYPVSLLQLATRDAAWLFQFNLFSGLEGLYRLLANPRILKVGIGTEDDIRRLKERRPFRAAGFVDLGKIAETWAIQRTNLRALAGMFLGFRISKGEQRSNWARDPLTQSQLTYAATDAWVVRELYLTIIERDLLPPGHKPDSHLRRRKKSSKRRARRPAPRVDP